MTDPDSMNPYTDPLKPYLDWPAATTYLRATLDPRLIENHASAILSRSLGGRRMVAFLGAGVSMAYGRISWKALVDSELVDLKRAWEAADSDGRLAALSLGVQAHLKGLYDTVNELDPKRPDVRADRYPMVFQVCEQLWDAMQKTDLLHKRQPTPMGDKRASDERLLEQRTMDRVRDELGHAKEILRKVLTDAELNWRPDEPMRPEIVRNVVAEVFSRNIVRKLTPSGKGAWDKKLCDAIDAAVYVDEEDNPALVPTHRFLVGVLLKLPGAGPTSVFPLDNFSDKAQPRERDRAHIVGQWRDPLILLHERLLIQRYLTTNYDHEIQRLFDDLRLRRSNPADDLRDDSWDEMPPTRASYAVTVFDEARSGELISFAVQDRGVASHAVHLHGQASTSGHIIVTESDYQKRYLGDPKHRDLIDGGLSLAFGANPMLFVGSNMGEDDILRPLRQFASMRHGRILEASVALLPGKFALSQCLEEKIALLGRFGVYAIHFGDAAVQPPKMADSESGLQQRINNHAFWLPWIMQIIKETRGILDAIKRQTTPNKSELLKQFDMAGPDPKPLTRATLASPGPGFDPAQFVASGGGGDQGDRTWSVVEPRMIEGIHTEGETKLNVGFEVKLLNLAVSFALVESERVEDKSYRESMADALLAALDGVSDSLMTVFTTARLVRVRWEWDEWRKAWFTLPDARKSEVTKRFKGREQIEGSARIHEKFWLVDTHALDLPELPEVPLDSDPAKQPDGASPKFGRYHANSGSHSVDGFLEALCAAWPLKITGGRRVVYVATRRGTGRGHFFAGLQARGALGRLLEELTPPYNQTWRAAAFFNLSFSHEVSNCFDRIANMLYECLPGDPVLGLASRRDWEALRNDRIERLRFALEAWLKRRDGGQRILIAINAVDLLFDRLGTPGGSAKNGEVKQLFSILQDTKYKAVPIDLLFVSLEDRLPLLIGADGRPNLPLLLPRITADAKTRALEQARYAAIATHIQRPLQPASSVPVGDSVVFFLHEERVTMIAARYFPRIALLMARHGLLAASIDKTPRSDPYPAIFYHDETAVHFRRAIAECLRDQAHQPNGRAPARYFVPLVIAALAWLLDNNPPRGSDNRPFDKGIADVLMELSKDKAVVLTDMERGATVIVTALAKITAVDEEGLFPEKTTREELARVLLKGAESFDQQCRNLLRMSAGSRFGVTLLLTAAYEITSELTWQKPASNGFVERSRIDLVGQQMHRFLERIGHELAGTTEQSRTMVIITQVMRLWQRHHQRHAPLPLRLHLRPAVPVAASGETSTAQRGKTIEKGDVIETLYYGPVQMASPPMFDLMEQIIWHLAVIGGPTDMYVLLRCPRIRAAASDLFQFYAKPLGQELLCDATVDDIRTMVAECLALGVNRSIIIPLQPTATEKWYDVCGGKERRRRGRKPSQEFPERFTVHRMVQRHVFHQLGAPDIEAGEVDRFTVTLFASQPDNIPKVDPAAEHRIRELVKALIIYPEETIPSDHGTTYLDPPEDWRRVRMLRAALGVLRSIYSMGVLTRFEKQSDPSSSGVGRMEEHRLLIRWMIKAAAELNRYHETGKDPEPAFYADEIVWLYNECGLLSLAQGRLPDAYSLFNQALRAAERDLEPDHLRPISLRISLNRALVDIERGRPDAARAVLVAISHVDPMREQPVPILLAHGYLGLIEHLAGNTEVAKRKYDVAINGLRKLRRSRAVAIFCKHKADLLRSEGDAKAEHYLAQALDMAQEGQHEDVRHMALLSQAHHRIDSADSARATRAIHDDLETVEEYAGFTGMVRLSCEVAAVRARLLLTQGETRQASMEAVRSLELAAANGLRLRKMHAMLLLAEICRHRQLDEVAQPLLREAVLIARNAKCHLMLRRIQDMQSGLPKRNSSA